MKRYTPSFVGMIAMALFLCSLVLTPYASAQAQTPPAAPTATTTTTSTTTSAQEQPCTDFASLKATAEAMKEPGILTNITTYIKDVINGASQKLFEAFTKSSSYQAAVNAAVTLMIVIYGVAFMIGVAQPSFGQVLIRLVKVGVIYAVISPGGWQFFSDYAVKFFNDGTDDLIRTVMNIGTGIPLAPGDSPFKALDGLAKFVLSPDMIIAMMSSTFASGSYGLMMGALMAFAVGGLLKMLVEALKTYALSFIMRALLLGIAPLFIVFLLFDKTKQLFTGWLNALINLSLQPILYFTFISFFVVMLSTSAYSMLGGAEICWSDVKAVQGSQNKIAFWRFKMKGETTPSLESWTWEGSLSCLMSGKAADGKSKCPEFPINIVDLLSFLILVYVAQRFSDVVARISSELSSAFVNLDTQTRFQLGQQQGGGEKNLGNKNRGGATN